MTTGPQISQEEGISQGTRHLSFENWVDGSPHDSEEYDTDVEEEKKPGEWRIMLSWCTLKFLVVFLVFI